MTWLADEIQKNLSNLKDYAYIFEGKKAVRDTILDLRW
jgi:hypothetical protein